MPIDQTPRTVAVLALAVALLTGCSVSTEHPDEVATTDPATTDPTTAADPTTAPASPSPTTPSPTGPDVATVPGYGPGEFPPVPLFQLPDLGLLDAALSGFTYELTELVGDYPGLTIAPARCDEAGEVTSGPGSLLLYGDGSGTYVGPDGSSVNYGDGSGSFVIGGVSFTVYGDGSGTYAGNGLSITNHGDGSGSYVDSEAGLSITVYGDGSGTWVRGGVSITNYGDGSGTSVDSVGGVSITNYGDGSGSFAGPEISMVNHGDGTGTVNGTSVEMSPLPAVDPIGVFPPMGALEPVTSCGTTITLDSAVLFDIDSYEIRPDAAAVLDSLAQALVDADVPAADVSGHTDSVRDEAWNQQLSEDRADAVTAALADLGVTAELTTVGYGESRPVASNDTDAGRQLNRRVEIFIPAF